MMYELVFYICKLYWIGIYLFEVHGKGRRLAGLKDMEVEGVTLGQYYFRTTN